ncbi:MAG: hypothetical protein RIS62_624 [Chloroflexota bacterium]
MTMTRPCRLITRHLSQRTLTDAETFTSSPAVSGAPLLLLLQPVGDPTLGQIVWREFDLHPITGKDSDEIRPKLSTDVGTNPVAVFELNYERRVRQRLHYGPLDFDRIFLRQQTPDQNALLGPGRPRRRTTESADARRETIAEHHDPRTRGALMTPSSRLWSPPPRWRCCPPSGPRGLHQLLQPSTRRP